MCVDDVNKPHSCLNRTIAVFTATRAEYGLLRNTLRLIQKDPELNLRLIIGGTHLSEAHGRTVQEIIDDGFEISTLVPMDVANNDSAGLVSSMNQCMDGMGRALLKIKPDLLLLLGDRYELLPAACLATVLRIPIAHLCGGDVTEGAIDNQVRHAITKMAHLHLVGTQEAADRILQMGEDPAHVTVTGQPGLDEFVSSHSMDRNELACSLKLDPAKQWILFTYHPETLEQEGVDVARVTGALNVLSNNHALQSVLTASNADRGGSKLNAIMRNRSAAEPTQFRFVESLGHTRFVSMMRQSSCMVGNSSAGIIEAASVPVPVINFGRRQLGRFSPPNVIHIEGDEASFSAALAQIETHSFRSRLANLRNPYGDGHAAARIVRSLKLFVNNPSTNKGFFDHALEGHGPQPRTGDD